MYLTCAAEYQPVDLGRELSATTHGLADEGGKMDVRTLERVLELRRAW